MKEPTFGKLLQLLAAERKSRLSFSLSHLDILFLVFVDGKDAGQIQRIGRWLALKNRGIVDGELIRHTIRPEDPDMFDKLEEFFLTEEASAK